ncbi:membrane DNA delivery [Enterobacteria phage PRDsepia]
MNDYIGPIVTVLTAIIGVAILATLVSNRANTANVIKAGAGGFSNMLGTALSPVTGGSGFSMTNNYSGF